MVGPIRKRQRLSTRPFSCMVLGDSAREIERAANQDAQRFFPDAARVPHGLVERKARMRRKTGAFGGFGDRHRRAPAGMIRLHREYRRGEASERCKKSVGVLVFLHAANEYERLGAL